jgi:nitroreductase
MPGLSARLALLLGHLLELLPRPPATLSPRQRLIRRRRQRTVTRVAINPPLQLLDHSRLLRNPRLQRVNQRRLLGHQRLQLLIAEPSRTRACRSHACNIPCKSLGSCSEACDPLNAYIFFCSLGAAIQNIQLATIACGLTSAWLSGGGEEQTARELREILQFPQSARPYGTIPIGYPARYPDSKWRRPLEQMVHWNGFSADQYRPQALVEHYVHDVRSFAMYRPFEHMEDWDDLDDRAGTFTAAYTGRVTNSAGALPNPRPAG